MGSCWPVQTEIAMRVAEPAIGLGTRTLWCYSPADPWALTVNFDLDRDESPPVWRFARDLVAAGCQASAGIGDMKVYPLHGRVAMRLTSPDGTAVVTARLEDVQRFVRTTYQWVPAGQEGTYGDVDGAVDRALQQFLGEQRPW